MGYSWNNFGVLVRESEDELYLYIHNQNGEFRQISKKKYFSDIPNLRQKIKTLLGKPINFRTSQNTSDWPTSKWFSDINIDKEGYQDPSNIIPFSKNDFKDSDEPQPESNDVLKSRLAAIEAELSDAQKSKETAIAEKEELKKESFRKAFEQSEKIEELKSDKSEMQDRLSEAELKNSKLIAQTKDIMESLSITDQKNIVSDSNELSSMNLIGSEHSIKARGHPVRELALRIGIVLPNGKKTIKMKFINHVTSNRYRVSLPEFSNVEADAFIRLEPNKNMFVASFLNTDIGWFERFEKIIGEKDQAYKNRTDLSSEQLVEIYNKVIGT